MQIKGGGGITLQDFEDDAALLWLVLDTNIGMGIPVSVVQLWYFPLYFIVLLARCHFN